MDAIEIVKANMQEDKTELFNLHLLIVWLVGDGLCFLRLILFLESICPTLSFVCLFYFLNESFLFLRKNDL